MIASINADMTASIDWLEFTVMGLTVEEVQVDILGLSSQEFSKLDKGRFGYRNQLKWSEGNLFILHNKETVTRNETETSKTTDTMGVHVMITGTGCRCFESRRALKQLLLFLTVLDDKVNFSRIDLAIDDFKNKTVNFERIHEAAINRHFTSRWNKWDELNSRKCATGEYIGRTMYFGSQTSSIFCRIYDKALERIANGEKEEKVYDTWTRLEIIYKKDRAKMLVYYIVDNDLPVGHAIRGTLNQYIRFIIPPKNADSNKSRWPSADWWNELLAGVDKLQLTIQQETKSIDDMTDWVERQIAPTMAAILTAKNGEIDWLHQILSKGATRLSQRHRDAIEQYKQEVLNG